MNRLLTQGEVCELLRISYPTLCRWLNAETFPQPVNGRRRKLLFDPDAVEAWIKNQRGPPVSTPAVTCSTKQRNDTRSFQERQRLAELSLQKHSLGHRPER